MFLHIQRSTIRTDLFMLNFSEHSFNHMAHMWTKFKIKYVSECSIWFSSIIKNPKKMNLSCQIEQSVYALCHHISDRCFPPILTSFFRRNRNVCKNIISYSLMISTRGCSQLDLILTTRWDSNVKNSIGICELFHIWISRFGWDSFDYKPCRLPSEEASVSCHTLIKMCMTVFIIITIYFL
jgi:hypothetical protein